MICEKPMNKDNFLRTLLGECAFLDEKATRAMSRWAARFITSWVSDSRARYG